MKLKTLTGGAVYGALGLLLATSVWHGGRAVSAPESSSGVAPIAVAKPAAGTQQATLAAGCFWSMEAIFQQLKGVKSVEPGYAGGTVRNPSYEQVCEKNTGRAETINVIFDPSVISYRRLLQVMLTERDPTSLNRQGNDEGPEYRSVIFARDAAQKKVAEQALKEVAASHLWSGPIVTKVEPFTNFYRAEDYHLNYYNLHPNEGYTYGVIRPELDKFRKDFAGELK